MFEEAMANKNSGKFDNSSIDFQIAFYKKEGLTPYSEDKLPITSGRVVNTLSLFIDLFNLQISLILPLVFLFYMPDVPEGCVIIREHVPITDLFSCLWFNEVDRFTPRDQLSFSTVRDKIRAKTNWTVNMFLDCERRNFVIQVIFSHSDLPLSFSVDIMIILQILIWLQGTYTCNIYYQ